MGTAIAKVGIEGFLTAEYGPERGGEIYREQQAELEGILKATSGKSKSQMRTLTKTILPRVALYKVLERQKGGEEALAVLREYMFGIVGAAMGKRYSRLEAVPGFFWLFRKVMANFVIASDNWDCEMLSDNSREVSYNITRCLWLDACIENNCPELCPVFCDTDGVMYSQMKKVLFVRSSTLAKGGECCDFCYRRVH